MEPQRIIDTAKMLEKIILEDESDGEIISRLSKTSDSYLGFIHDAKRIIRAQDTGEMA